MKLGCQARPKAERIAQYLATLRRKEQPPPRPEILYPELVAALKRETDSCIHEDEEILWTGNGYNAPVDTILGSGWDGIFLGIVPTINTSSSVLNRAYQELGTRKRPEQRHWRHFFVCFGENYREHQSSLTSRQKGAMRTAYRRCKDDMPSLPADVPWLLDDTGHLHTTSDAMSGRVVIEDDLPLGAELRKTSTTVSFVDTAPEIEPFFRQQGVKRLTEIRRKIGDRVGRRRAAPGWFQEKEYLRRLGNADFGSALVKMAARDFIEGVQGVQRVVKRLSALEEIAFADNIRASLIIPISHLV